MVKMSYKSLKLLSLGFLALILILSTIFLQEKEQVLLLATTTSTYDSGLLDYLLPEFQQKYNIEVKVIPTGTGQAIKNGERGDVDIILVHAPEAEKKFVNDGFGVNRSCVMYNDFIIIRLANYSYAIISINRIGSNRLFNNRWKLLRII